MAAPKNNGIRVVEYIMIKSNNFYSSSVCGEFICYLIRDGVKMSNIILRIIKLYLRC